MRARPEVAHILLGPAPFALARGPSADSSFCPSRLAGRFSKLLMGGFHKCRPCEGSSAIGKGNPRHVQSKSPRKSEGRAWSKEKWPLRSDEPNNQADRHSNQTNGGHEQQHKKKVHRAVYDFHLARDFPHA